MSAKLFPPRQVTGIQLRTVIQCPHCGFKITEKMPLSRKVMVYHCPSCNEYSHVDSAQCCIFCQFARLSCPEKQQLALDCPSIEGENTGQ